MDLNKLSRGDQVIGISGIVLLISSFLSWFKVEIKGFGAGSATGNAWDFTIAWLAVIIGVLMVVYVLLKAASVDLPEAPWPLILLIAGGVAFLFVLLKLIAGVDTDVPAGFPGEVESKRQIGVFIALIASAGLAVGAWLNFQESRSGGTTPSPGGTGGGPTV